MADNTNPRETLIFTQSGTFNPSDYPWMVACRVHVKGADAGTVDGPGEAGQVIVELFDREIDDVCPTCGASGPHLSGDGWAGNRELLRCRNCGGDVWKLHT
jgi:hypothetical protein